MRWQHDAVAMGAVAREYSGGHQREPTDRFGMAPAIEPLPMAPTPMPPHATVTATATTGVTTTVTTTPPRRSR